MKKASSNFSQCHRGHNSQDTTDQKHKSSIPYSSYTQITHSETSSKKQTLPPCSCYALPLLPSRSRPLHRWRHRQPSFSLLLASLAVLRACDCDCKLSFEPLRLRAMNFHLRSLRACFHWIENLCLNFRCRVLVTAGVPLTSV